MFEYELFRARERELIATADRDRMVRTALRARRERAEAARALRRADRDPEGVGEPRRRRRWGAGIIRLSER